MNYFFSIFVFLVSVNSFAFEVGTIDLNMVLEKDIEYQNINKIISKEIQEIEDEFNQLEEKILKKMELIKTQKNNLSPKKINELKDEILKLKLDLFQKKENYSNNLIEQELKLKNTHLEKIYKTIRDFHKEKREFDIIIKKNNTNILSLKKSTDLTSEFIIFLNK